MLNKVVGFGFGLLLLFAFAGLITHYIDEWRLIDTSEAMLLVGPYLVYIMFGGILGALVWYLFWGRD